MHKTSTNAHDILTEPEGMSSDCLFCRTNATTITREKPQSFTFEKLKPGKDWNDRSVTQFVIFLPSAYQLTENCFSSKTFGNIKSVNAILFRFKESETKESITRCTGLTDSLPGFLSALWQLSQSQGSHLALLHTHTHTHLNDVWWVITQGQAYWWSPRKPC